MRESVIYLYYIVILNNKSLRKSANMWIVSLQRYTCTNEAAINLGFFDVMTHWQYWEWIHWIELNRMMFALTEIENAMKEFCHELAIKLE